MTSDSFTLVCTRCGAEKPQEAFPPNKRVSTGRDSWCRVCRSEYVRAWRQRAYVKARTMTPEQRERRRQTMRAWKLATKYGLTVEDVAAMIEAQGGLCAICRRRPVSLELVTRKDSERTCIEHDHVTNKVRGITCLCCNLILGYADDDPAVLARAIEYLKRATDE